MKKTISGTILEKTASQEKPCGMGSLSPRPPPKGGSCHADEVGRGETGHAKIALIPQLLQVDGLRFDVLNY